MVQDTRLRRAEPAIPMKTCPQCSTHFEISLDDLAFYEKVKVPEPTLCPACRQQRRLSWRNERSFYHRKCDLSSKQIISLYSAGKPFEVFHQDEWWSDKWDPLEYGRDFDFSRTFFEQFGELLKAVPRISLINTQHENSEYCNYAVGNKNSYLLFTSGKNENSLYSNRCWNNRDICDCSNLANCELCYETIDSETCYRCAWVENSSGCSDCSFCFDMKGCQYCFACFGLHNKKFCIGNKQFSEEEYKKIVPELLKDVGKLLKNFQKQKATVIRCFTHGVNNENSTGDYNYNCKNAKHCFEVTGIQDCSYVSSATELKDCYDVDNDDHSELVVEACGSESNYMHRFNESCWFDKYCSYCSLCFYCENCFGCVGLKRKKYCILNKQYTKEEYEALVPKIIEHMKKTGEYGEFFPTSLSPFGYNETMARDYYPMRREDVLKKGWKWEETLDLTHYQGPKYDPPLDIKAVTDDIIGKILICEKTARPYKVIKQELDFYRTMNLPIPRMCPEQRYLDRLSRRNPRKLWKRKCEKCQAPFETSFALERPEKVTCERCYLEQLY